MFFKKLNKKGVSPIIATVLLIAFAVALGAVVMNWGKGFVESTAKNTEEKSNLELACQQELQLSVKKIAGTPKVCYKNQSSPYIKVMLENSGTQNITGLQFVIIDSNDATEINKTTISIGPGSVTSYNTIGHNLTGDIVQIEVIPMILPRGATTSQLCSKNALEISDIASC